MQDFSTFEGIFHASGATLTVALYVYAKERADFAEAFAIAAVLLCLAAVLNLTAAMIRRAGTRGRERNRQEKGRNRR